MHVLIFLNNTHALSHPSFPWSVSVDWASSKFQVVVLALGSQDGEACLQGAWRLEQLWLKGPLPEGWGQAPLAT